MHWVMDMWDHGHLGQQTHWARDIMGPWTHQAVDALGHGHVGP